MSILGTLKKTNNMETRIRKVDYKGNTYIDTRNHFKNNSNEWIPTRKGIMIPVRQLSEFITVLEKAEATLTKETQNA